MNKKFNILILYYSQTGKTKNILDIFLKPLIDDQEGIDLEFVEINPQKPFPFPWSMIYFFSIMPETVYEAPIPLQELNFDENKRYDLIILGTPVWFLAPALSITSLFTHPKNKVFSNTPVITVITCRKMWFQALASLEKRLNKLNSWMIDKIVISVKGSQIKTLSGTDENLFDSNKSVRKNKIWTYDQENIDQIARMGNQLFESLEQIKKNPRMPVFTEKSAAIENATFLYPEKITKNSFLLWGKFFIKYSHPDTRFRYFLTAIYICVFMFKAIIGMPFFELYYKLTSLKKRKKYEFAIN